VSINKVATNIDFVKYEIKIDDSWQDITSDVISDTTCSYGIRGNGPKDRIANTGTLSFYLRNDAGNLGGKIGFYSPYNSNSKSGWRTGLPVRLTIGCFDYEFVKFYGHISNMQSDNSDNSRVKITCVDWLDYANNHPIVAPVIQYSKNAAEGIDAVLATMPIQPLATEFNTCETTFPTIFDITKSNTKATSEFNKMVLSEYGFLYLKSGEKLVLEGRKTRNASNTIKKTPVSKINSGSLKINGGGYLLLNTGDRIKINAAQELIFDNSMIDLDVSYGTNLINHVAAKSYPRRVDTSNVVLYAQSDTMTLEPGETKSNIRGMYSDPNGGNKVNAKSIETPISGTDYIMNARADGIGTNLNANLVITYNAGAESVIYSVTNTSAVKGYILKLQFKGLGIYTYTTTEDIAESEDSINTYGYADIGIEMKYMDDSNQARSIANIILNQEKNPRLVLNKINMIANSSDFAMNAFLYSDIGDLIYVKERKNGVDGYYYIQGADFFINNTKKSIGYSWILKDAFVMTEQFWTLGIVGKSELGSTTIVY
jgi:hypothetical protein